MIIRLLKILFILSYVPEYFIHIYYLIFIYYSISIYYLMFLGSNSGCLAGSSPALSIYVLDRCRCDFSTRSDEFNYYFYLVFAFVSFGLMIDFFYALCPRLRLLLLVPQ